MIYDFFKISCDNEDVLDLRDLSKVQFQNDSVQAFDTKWDEVFSAVTESNSDNIFESLHKMQVGKSEELKPFMKVYAQETTFGNWKMRTARRERTRQIERLRSQQAR